MKRFLFLSLRLFPVLLVALSLTGCLDLNNGDEDIEFPLGEFPDTVMNMQDINSQYDDYNANILSGAGPILFSTNRQSNGGQFDIAQGGISFNFSQVYGTFEFQSHIMNDEFLGQLIARSVTTGDDFGPYRFYSSLDGYEYTVLSSETANGDHDLKYLRNMPQYGSVIPQIEGPFTVSLLNTESDDAYLCFDQNQDSVYFCSDRAGGFDIYFLKKPDTYEIDEWFNQGFTEASPVDSINSDADDKCPQIFRDLMVFTSDRPGGMGGFDLYYSVFRNGKWSSPVNFGPDINTEYNEYRPFIGYHQQFKNRLMIFSSNRPEGKGGYDLYFTGIDIGLN